MVHDTPLIQYIRDIFAAARTAGRPVLSFEFFPAKTEEGERVLLQKTIPALGQLEPDFCSVTYGAGGSTREKTLGIVDRIQREHGLTTMMHLTCVNATMRGDPRRPGTGACAGHQERPGAARRSADGGGGFVKTDGGFEFSYQLVRFIREAGAFTIGMAGFPEGHIACTDGKHQDWHRLKRRSIRARTS